MRETRTKTLVLLISMLLSSIPSNVSIIQMPQEAKKETTAIYENSAMAYSNGTHVSALYPIQTNETAISAQSPNYWALLACFTNYPSSASRTVQYMYHVLHDHYLFNGIYYLSVDTNLPGVNGSATVANIRWAIINWLASHSDQDDVIFIFTIGHGNGYNSIENRLMGGRPEVNSDEGEELRESTLGWDFTGDGKITDVWLGIDEEMLDMNHQSYWDDDIASDLNTLTYSRLIFIPFMGGDNDTGCFAGGLIDDVSAPNRIIMTETNETYYGWGAYDSGFSDWAGHFIDALHGRHAYYDSSKPKPIWHSLAVNADFNGDGHVSMKEAWDYAWANDYWRIKGLETPWLDDNGNGLPTYINEHDVLDPTDGSLAESTWLPKSVNEPDYDIAVTNVEPSQRVIYRGNRLNVTITVENEGFILAHFDIRAYCGGNLIGVKTIYNLIPGTNINVTFSLDTTKISVGTYTLSANASFIKSVGETNTADNNYVDGTINVLDMMPQNNQIVSGIVPIIVNATDDAGIQKVEFYIDGKLKENDTTSPYQYFWDTTPYTISRHAIKAIAYDYANKDYSNEIVVYIDRHDIAVTGVRLNFRKPYLEDGLAAGVVYPTWGVLYIIIVVTNEGSYTENVDVTANYTITVDPIIGNATDDLTPDASVCLVFKWNLTSVDWPLTDDKLFNWLYNLTDFNWRPYLTHDELREWVPSSGFVLGAVAGIVLGEKDMADNIKTLNPITVYMPGDCNGDGKVNQADLDILNAANGSSFGNPYQSYNWRADFNGDGIVDGVDKAILLSNWTE